MLSFFLCRPSITQNIYLVPETLFCILFDFLVKSSVLVFAYIRRNHSFELSYLEQWIVPAVLQKRSNIVPTNCKRYGYRVKKSIILYNFLSYKQSTHQTKNFQNSVESSFWNIFILVSSNDNINQKSTNYFPCPYKQQ